MAVIKPTITAYVSPLRKGKVRRDCSPYLQELALVVIAWNELHVELSQMFMTVSEISNGLVALRIWYSIENDRSQRNMLRVALESELVHLPRAKEKGLDWVKRAKDDILWIVNKTDGISALRNSAIHSPFLFVRQENKIAMQPDNFFFKSKKAELLAGKDLLREFRGQRQSYSALSSFAQRVRLALSLKPQPPWPDRSSVPPPTRKTSHNTRQKRAK
jgi:hypothetical protein